ncbi:MAG: T9SS type A sorting domain-containing protein [Bacteroidota bacterium]
MKKFLLILIAVILGFNFSYAQRKCGTMAYWEQQRAQDPTLESKRIALETWTQEMILAKKLSLDTVSNTIYIPIVFHIVYKTAAQNVSDARVQEQLDYMNTDYAGLNPHTMYLFAANLKANTKIQFCLAQRKPNGTATNGIERRLTTVSSFNTNNNVKKYTTGGLDAWDVSKYMNVWVCNESGGILGYGQFPSSGINSTYGLVLHFEAFGHTGAIAPYDYGGTGSHEFGHCFNLYHIWGDDNGACTGTDYCADTPNQASENYGMPTFPHVTCSNGPLGDMLMNFMDYSDDLAYANFTPNQVDRIAALFLPGGPLFSLTTSNGCLPPSCDVPSGINTTPFGFTNAILAWTPTALQTSVLIQYHIQGDTNWTDTTLTGASVNSLTLNNLQGGVYYEWQISSFCSTDTSAFSSPSVFFTAQCVDTYEPNNLMSLANLIGINETNDTINALLNTHTDIDWYRFGMTNFKNVHIRLESLPGNYDLRVYRSNGVLLIKSTLPGNANEEVVLHNLKNGNYYIRISGADSSNVACYSLFLERNNTPVPVDHRSYNLETPGTGNARIGTPALGIYPNPAKNEVSISMYSESNTTALVNLLDLTGRECLAKSFTLTEGGNIMKLDLSSMVAGLYLVKLTQNGQISYNRLVVK